MIFIRKKLNKKEVFAQHKRFEELFLISIFIIEEILVAHENLSFRYVYERFGCNVQDTVSGIVQLQILNGL